MKFKDYEISFHKYVDSRGRHYGCSYSQALKLIDIDKDYISLRYAEKGDWYLITGAIYTDIYKAAERFHFWARSLNRLNYWYNKRFDYPQKLCGLPFHKKFGTKVTYKDKDQIIVDFHPEKFIVQIKSKGINKTKTMQNLDEKVIKNMMDNAKVLAL